MIISPEAKIADGMRVMNCVLVNSIITGIPINMPVIKKKKERNPKKENGL